MEQANSLRFKFDVSAYRLLGRELITDRITALFELVKNCYDANAEVVTIDFININPLTKDSKIVIRDNGIGMTFEDIRDKWMVIGTSSKRRNSKSPAPYNRKVAGKKGVGRFAVDKLGDRLLLKTKKKHSNTVICLETDWSFYAREEHQQLELDFDGNQKLFTDVDNLYWFQELNDNSQGTTLEISGINDVWSEKDLQRATKELSKLIRPNLIQRYPFDVYINAPQYPSYVNKKIESNVIEHATLSIELGYDIDNQKQEILSIIDGELTKILVPIRPCGLIGFTLYYYDQKAKAKFNKLTDDRVDGIKVYRDGLIATPFAEYADRRDGQKDLFGIDKRRWSGFFDKLSSRDLLGWVDIAEDRNPEIIDATNRQDFVDNDAWRELKFFVIEQIQKIEEYLKLRKNQTREKTKSEFNSASNDIGIIRQEINRLIQSSQSEENKKQLEDVSKKLSKAQASVNKGLSDFQRLEDEKKQQENLLFSLVSLQTYAAMLSHITRTSIGRIKRQAEYISKWIFSSEKNQICQKYGKYIFKEMNNLDRAVDFMLKYAKDDQCFTEINVKEALDNIFYNIYADEFARRGIHALLELNKELTIIYNLKAFEDIFDNLISNSLKALKNIEGEKIIKCSGIVEKNQLVIFFSDNGVGIKEEDKFRIFDVFYTTTADFGGAGLGLFIVKSRLESMQGSIEVIDNELKPTGVTFKIVLPLKK